MANISISPNMNLPVPVPGVDPGPDYSNNEVSCFNIIDGHNHTPGSGVAVPSSGININADLPFNAHNATGFRSVRFSPNVSALSGVADIGTLYEAGVDLYYNDGSGNQIRITQSGSVTGASGTITGLPSGTASASFSAVSGTFVFQQSTSTAANIDVGTVIVRYPGSYPTPAGNYIAIEAPSSLASGYSITLPALPGSNLPMFLSSTGVITTGQVATAQIANAAVTTTQIANQTIAQGNLALRATGSTVAAGGVGTSASTGNASFSSTPFVDMGISVTITTTGRPVKIGFIGDSSPPSPSTCQSSAANGVTLYFSKDNGATAISSYFFEFGGATSLGIPTSTFGTTDFPAAGTYTYKAFISVSAVAVSFTYSKLIVYEL